MNKEFDLSKYREIFKSETEQYLVQLNDYIVELEKNPASEEIIDAIFRNYHTIKGMAGTMGYKNIETLAHSLEDLLSLIKEKRITVNPQIIDLLLSGTDKIEYLKDKAGIKDEEVNTLLNNISLIKKGKETKKIVKKTRNFDRNNVKCEITLKKNTPLKGARAAVIINKIKEIADIIRYSPDIDDIYRGDFQEKFSVTLKTTTPLDKIKKELIGFSDIQSVDFKGGVKGEDIITGLIKKSDIRVGIKKLDSLQNLLSELVIAKETLKGFVKKGEYDNIFIETERISNIISLLQDEVVKIRMVPIWQVLERFPRIVRDTARALNKEVDFEIRGKDIELDRSMLENLAEPLLHLLRNAIYHGIESPDERKKLGKKPAGHLILEAERQRGMVVIKVIDDGRGMDAQKILRKAIETGVISEDKAGKLSEKEILSFVFISGFSTSSVIDEVSGRGVGLDVVKTRLRILGGTFDFKTYPHKGTTFILKVPLTMAIIKAFLINVGKEVYAIPLTFVEETIEIQRELIKTLHSKELFVLRDEVIPNKRLHNVFGIQNGIKRDSYPAVIVNYESKKVALIASEFLEHSDIVVKTLPRTQSYVKEFAGVTILSDGRPALIIDIPNIV